MHVWGPGSTPSIIHSQKIHHRLHLVSTEIRKVRAPFLELQCVFKLCASKALKFPVTVLLSWCSVAGTPATHGKLPSSASDCQQPTRWRRPPSGSAVLSAQGQWGAHTAWAAGVSVFAPSAEPPPHCSSPGKGWERRVEVTHSSRDKASVSTRDKSVPANLLQWPLGSSGSQLSLHIHSGLSFPTLFYMPARIKISSILEYDRAQQKRELNISTAMEGLGKDRWVSVTKIHCVHTWDSHRVRTLCLNFSSYYYLVTFLTGPTSVLKHSPAKHCQFLCSALLAGAQESLHFENKRVVGLQFLPGVHHSLSLLI